jgi:hypothetical protein
VALRQVQTAGENAGQLSLTIMTESERKRAEVLDTVRGEQLMASVTETMQGANPPAQVVSRVWLNEIGGPGDVPQPTPVLTTILAQPASGWLDEAVAALEAARAKHLRLGLTPRVFRVVNGGALTGAFIYGLTHASLTALQDFVEANAAGGRLPLRAAADAGALTGFAQSLSFQIEL